MAVKAQIIIEQEETLILRQSSATMNEFCSVCGMLTVMVTPEALAMMSGVSERNIFRLIEANEIHFFEGPKVYVCLNSLNEFKGTEDPNRSKENESH